MANFNFNKVILGGRMTADPELKTTPSGIAVTTFTVAVNRRFSGKNEGEAQADFFNVTAWRATAEFICKYFKKASSICVMGSLQTRSWVDKDGQKRYATEIVADEAYFVDAKAEMPIAVQPAASAAMAQQTAPTQGTYIPDAYTQPIPQSAPNMQVLSADDELPFD
jgi:single-strand DNA-binding protein